MPSEPSFPWSINQPRAETPGMAEWRWPVQNLAWAERLFIASSAALLVLTAVAKLFSAMGDARILGVPDAVFFLPNRWLMGGVGLLELAAVVYLACGHSATRKLMTIGALSVNFGLYRLGNWLLGAAVCPCLGTLTDSLHIPAESAEFSLKLVLAYFFIGSSMLLGARWLGGGDHDESSSATSPVAGRTT